MNSNEAMPTYVRAPTAVVAPWGRAAPRPAGDDADATVTPWRRHRPPLACAGGMRPCEEQ